MKEELASARKHPAALASIVIASVAVTALALVTIGYLLGYVPTRGGSTPGSMAIPGQQVTGTVNQSGVDLLPGETLVATPEASQGPASTPAPAPSLEPGPTIQQYAKPAPLAPPKPAIAKTQPPVYTQPAAPTPSTSYAQVLPSRAAPSKPNYAPRDYCVNCGTIASIGSAPGGDWEVRVRFEDGSTETLRYPDRPRLRIGERVHLEDGRLIPE
jgi:hypothetical protein